MAQKRILFTINHAPVGSIHYSEGLRAAVGATSGIDEHKVDVVYLGDGVYFALKKADRRDSAKYIDTLAQSGCRLKAEQESMDSQHIAREELAEDVEVISREAVRGLAAQADFTVDF